MEDLSDCRKIPTISPTSPGRQAIRVNGDSIASCSGNPKCDVLSGTYYSVKHDGIQIDITHVHTAFVRLIPVLLRFFNKPRADLTGQPNSRIHKLKILEPQLPTAAI